MLPQSSSDDNAIHYVLLVLWMTSCFHIMGHIQITSHRLWTITVRNAVMLILVLVLMESADDH